MSDKPDIGIVGLGYVGLTLAVTLADLGFRVWGYERQLEVVEKLKKGQSHIFEPGVNEVLQAQLGHGLFIDTTLPDRFSGITIICVSTPIASEKNPDLRNLCEATEQVTEAITDGSLVIVRSTVPVGTCRKILLPLLRAKHKEVRLAFCPERTIQGQALRELRELPQVVGALDMTSAQLAAKLWEQVTRRVVLISSLEAGEMVKLINNSHTDLLYSFGNEVAMMAQGFSLDPTELIRTANVGYPRPDLARPGFVGGPCMSKDPYLLLTSLDGSGYVPRLAGAARAINEELPLLVGRHLVDILKGFVGDMDSAKVLICGFAYKGWPPTDDMRGSPVVPIVNALRQYPLRLYGHDFLVPSETIEACGVIPETDVTKGFKDARAVLFVNEHPSYSELEILGLVQRMTHPAVIYDCWRMFDARSFESEAGIHYAGIGYG